VVALLVGLQGLIRPSLLAYRNRWEAKAHLAMTSPMLSDLSRSSRSYEMRFEVSNIGRNPAIVRAIRLRVLDDGPSTEPRETVTEAPLTVHQHRIEFHPDKKEYDVRSRQYGPKLPPLSFHEGETEAFVVKLVAAKPHRYAFRLELDWYDARAPDVVRCLYSDRVLVDFPPSPQAAASPDAE